MRPLRERLCYVVASAAPWSPDVSPSCLVKGRKHDHGFATATLRSGLRHRMLLRQRARARPVGDKNVAGRPGMPGSCDAADLCERPLLSTLSIRHLDGPGDPVRQ